MKIRSIVFCLIAGITLSFCNNQKRLLRIAKKEMDPKNWIKPTALYLDFNAESDMKVYSDSLNNLTNEAALPAFIFDECFDYKPMLWPDMHHAISLRQMVVKKVTNRLAIQRILQDDNPLLHKVCDAEGEIEVPDGDKPFYELFRLRYAELQEDEKKGRDSVPDAETAIKVAEAVWLPIYGNRIYNEKPFTARLENNKVWIIEGTLKGDSINRSKPNPNPRSISIVVGGVAYIEIQKSDCKILQVSHGK